MFTFIFGLKDNEILNQILEGHKSRKQLRYTSIFIIVSGFIDIALVISIIISPFLNNIIESSIHIIHSIIILITLLFYGHLALFIFVVVNVVFNNLTEKGIKVMDNPKIKKKMNN